jgi:hypothetical protein
MRVKLLSCLASAALLVAASASSALASPASTGAAPETSPIEKVQNDEFSARRGGGHFGGGRMHFGGGGFKHFGGHGIRHASFVHHRPVFVKHRFVHHRPFFVKHRFVHRPFFVKKRFFVRKRFFGPSVVVVGDSFCHKHWRFGFVFRHCHPFAFWPHHHRHHVRFVTVF